jgi:hypothetical protein
VSVRASRGRVSRTLPAKERCAVRGA